GVPDPRRPGGANAAVAGRDPHRRRHRLRRRAVLPDRAAVEAIESRGAVAMLELRGVSIRYGATTAVDDVTLTAAAGRWLGLVGPNGAGKSSLLRAVAHLVPYRGRMTIDGRPARQLSRRQLATLVAYVPQQPEWPAGMTALDYT